jgi:tetratricopeptide (TPR) repeat protein
MLCGLLVVIGCLAILSPIARGDEIEDLYDRGNKALDDGDNDLAISCANRILRLDPNEGGAYVTLSAAYGNKGDYDKAVANATEALTHDLSTEDQSMAYNNRGYYTIQKSLDNYKKAIADYDKALAINPNNTYALSNYAWLLATHPNDNVRDGKKAWKLAKKAYELDSGDGTNMNVLAAAFGECGDFEQAIHWEKKALEASKIVGQATKDTFRANLKLYQEGKPFRDKD